MQDDDVFLFLCKRKNIKILLALLELERSFKRELELKLGIHQTTIAESLNELILEKLVTVTPGDGRIKKYYQLTSQGKKVAKSIEQCLTNIRLTLKK